MNPSFTETLIRGFLRVGLQKEDIDVSVKEGVISLISLEIPHTENDFTEFQPLTIQLGNYENDVERVITLLRDKHNSSGVAKFLNINMLHPKGAFILYQILNLMMKRRRQKWLMTTTLHPPPPTPLLLHIPAFHSTNIVLKERLAPFCKSDSNISLEELLSSFIIIHNVKYFAIYSGN